ncbi:hypothetical protein BT63DRAFT_84440 [Microthyrium microscopicum]|uniref:RING-type E3 ubiquitin transferase n=1 Tax=Microthyrium microscopicum TaxID=703497 RepID=A0A6A6TYA9_9PEZI|nr:hypothetical protein BT63DRAFT_84440 [Microthyrium microscopicum]
MAESSSSADNVPLSEPVHETPKTTDDCAICLAAVSERAIAVPCNHCCFDFLCLASWAAEQPTCPLCKTALTAIEYDWTSPTDFKIYLIPTPQTTPQHRAPARGRPSRRRPHDANDTEVDTALIRRRNIYTYQRYSLHIGSNRHSGFRNITASMIAQSATLQARASMWMRRELRVFGSLRHSVSDSPSRSWEAGRVFNAEYLLRSTLESLKLSGVKGGDAEEVLAGRIGRENARLFLHELGSWMRSPFESLEEWDRFVQYPAKNVVSLSAESGVTDKGA